MRRRSRTRTTVCVVHDGGMSPPKFCSGSSRIATTINGAFVDALQYLHVVPIFSEGIGRVQLATVAAKDKYLAVGYGKDGDRREIPTMRTPPTDAITAPDGRLAPRQRCAIQDVQIVKLPRGIPSTHDVQVVLDNNRLMSRSRLRTAARRLDVVPLPVSKAECVNVGKVPSAVARTTVSSKDDENAATTIILTSTHDRCRM